MTDEATTSARKSSRTPATGDGRCKGRPAATPPTKLDRMVALLVRPEGASLAELSAASGWKRQSVRGALAGALKNKGHAIVADRIDVVRRYRIGASR